MKAAVCYSASTPRNLERELLASWLLSCDPPLAYPFSKLWHSCETVTVTGQRMPYLPRLGWKLRRESEHPDQRRQGIGGKCASLIFRG